jgi:hypothetical protein
VRQLDVTYALNGRIRGTMEGLGDQEFDPAQVAEAYTEANGLPAGHPMYFHAIADVKRRVKSVLKKDTTNGIPTWMWTGRGSVFQLASAMPLGTIEHLEFRNEATIEGLLRRKRMLRAMHLIRDGVDAGLAARQAQTEHETLLEALSS